ncbi:hypothetical protein ONZ43_g1907 [Nemania bipapillata]|uniref:Uncharacterized protein n=1 Tax=Nemania bipapillata TaxID=110536 RepID=A0ACC2J2X2_9PEZI|nr:hypothetical protein ONZ43_g1907 [Nemania bipapillata]
MPSRNRHRQQQIQHSSPLEFIGLSTLKRFSLVLLPFKMKAAFLTFFAIGGFIASSIANPIALSNSVEKRQDDDYAELGASLTTLLANIQKQTAIISE